MGKKAILVSILFCLIQVTGCSPKAKSADDKIDYEKDLSGEYVSEWVKEVTGKDPLGGSPMKITVTKEDTFYVFAIHHRDKIISKIRKPSLDREFAGRMDEAESDYVIKRTTTGLACEIMADNKAYHFVVFFTPADDASS